MTFSAFIAKLIKALLDFLAKSGQSSTPRTPRTPRQSRPGKSPRRPTRPTYTQPKTPKPSRLPRKGAIAASATALTLATATIGGYEGLRTKAYQDAVGVWTVCYGETLNVTPTTTHTTQECDAMLARRVAQFEAELDACLNSPKPIPIETKIALVSWAYNVGTPAACRSTLVKFVNQGDLKAACNELPRWNRAGGEVLTGLTTRRLSERTMCLRGIGQ